MKSYLYFLLITFYCSLSLSPANITTSEEAYRLNNMGVALLEQYKHDEAVEQFKRALALKPDFQMAKINLAIALYNAQKLVEAKQAVAAALVEAPESPQANYVLGLIWRTENDQNESLAAFERVLKIDPKDVGANVNIGQIFSQQKRYDEAIRHFQTAYDAEPYNTTAIYNLATALQRTGDRGRAAGLLKTFQILCENGAGTSISLNYLEQGDTPRRLLLPEPKANWLINPSRRLSFRNRILACNWPSRRCYPCLTMRFYVIWTVTAI